MWEILDVGGTRSRQITSFEVHGAHDVRSTMDTKKPYWY